MTGKTWHRTKNGTDFDREEWDWYVEPIWSVESLLIKEHFVQPILDPCAGMGTIGEALEKYGYTDVILTDIATRDFANVSGGSDFLDDDYYEKVPSIITNPPYKNCTAFIQKALELATHKVAVIVRDSFLYSAERYFNLFVREPPTRIYHSSTRPSMPPGRLLVEGKMKQKGGQRDYSWLVWDRTVKHPVGTQTFWIIKEGAKRKWRRQ